MENKVFLGTLLFLLFGLFLGGVAYGDILLQEGSVGTAVVYRVSPDGTGLVKIGLGFLPRWSPDRNRISYMSSEPRMPMNLLVVSPEREKLVDIPDLTKMGLILDYEWHPNGKSMAVISMGPEGAIFSYDIEARERKTLHRVEFRELDEALLSTTLRWSPRGNYIVFSPGAIISRGEGVDLIDFGKGSVKNLASFGSQPRFLSENEIIFVSGTEIWTINVDGSKKKKVVDVRLPLLSVTDIVNNRMVILAKAKDLPGEVQYRLFLLDLRENSLEEVRAPGLLLFSPEISPTGDKVAVIGVKEVDGMPLEETEKAGCYVYDLENGKLTLLKKLDRTLDDKAFWSNIYMGGRFITWE